MTTYNSEGTYRWTSTWDCHNFRNDINVDELLARGRFVFSTDGRMIAASESELDIGPGETVESVTIYSTDGWRGYLQSDSNADLFSIKREYEPDFMDRLASEQQPVEFTALNRHVRLWQTVWTITWRGTGSFFQPLVLEITGDDAFIIGGTYPIYYEIDYLANAFGWSEDEVDAMMNSPAADAEGWFRLSDAYLMKISIDQPDP